MSWWSDKEEVSRWYLERTGDGDDYDQDDLIPDERSEEDIIAENLYLT